MTSVQSPLTAGRGNALTPSPSPKRARGGDGVQTTGAVIIPCIFMFVLRLRGNGFDWLFFDVSIICLPLPMLSFPRRGLLKNLRKRLRQVLIPTKSEL